MANTACQIAEEKIVYYALEERKKSAGMLLGCVRSVNSKKFPSEGFGVSYHTASSKPWFYDTAYKLVKYHSVIPVDDVLGVCFIAKPVKGREKRSPEHKCGAEIQHNCGAFFTKWECTAECKPLTDEQVTSIAVTKLLFEKPMQEIRKGLHDIDEGCPHIHFTHPLKVPNSDSSSNLNLILRKTIQAGPILMTLILRSPIQILMNQLLMNLLYPTMNCWVTLFRAQWHTVAASCLISELPLSTTHFCVHPFLIFSVQENSISLFLTLMAHYIQEIFCLLRSFVD